MALMVFTLSKKSEMKSGKPIGETYKVRLAFLLFPCIIHPWNLNHKMLNWDIAPLGKAVRQLLKKALENEEVNSRLNELRQDYYK
jgi:hypothetical protein